MTDAKKLQQTTIADSKKKKKAWIYVNVMLMLTKPFVNSWNKQKK